MNNNEFKCISDYLESNVLSDLQIAQLEYTEKICLIKEIHGVIYA